MEWMGGWREDQELDVVNCCGGDGFGVECAKGLAKRE